VVFFPQLISNLSNLILSVKCVKAGRELADKSFVGGVDVSVLSESVGDIIYGFLVVRKSCELTRLCSSKILIVFPKC